jgi:lipopolysaccharide transport system permease protein
VNSAKLTYYRDLIYVLVAKEFKLRYKSTFLGYAWSILNPLAFACVYFVVFRIYIRMDMTDPPYVLFLIAGLFPWQWCQNSVNASSGFLLGNSSLIKKVRFPRSMLVLAGVLNDMLHFLVAIPVIVAFMLWYHKYPSVAWLWGIPLLMLVQFAVTYSLSLLLAALNLFFRDIARLTVIMTMLWFFLTPVMYPFSMVPAEWLWSVYANPMAPLVICWQSLFLDGSILPARFPHPEWLLAAAFGWALVICVICQWLYRKLEWRFAELV